MQEINKRFDRIEERLLEIEQKLGIEKSVPVVSPPLSTVQATATTNNQTSAKPVSATPPLVKPIAIKPDDGWIAEVERQQPVTAAKVMAWFAGFAFVLAALYFLKLVYDTGWLTPLRQICIAYLGGMSLVVAGMMMEKRDHQYAAYLPAIALVVFYLTTFTAQLYYHLITSGVATGMVGVTTLLGLWLGRRFDHSVYVIFSAAGVYITPMLVHSPTGTLMDLVIYYSAWSLLFSFCAIQEQRRLTYLLPMFLAILGFDFIWRIMGAQDWMLSAVFQLVQFLIFGATTVMFSVRHEEPIDNDSAIIHGVALFVFYGIEYALLQQHVPEWVNYFAIASAVCVYLLYSAASRFYQGSQNLQSSATLVSCYCSWVAVHAGFFGEVNREWLPWAILSTPVIFVFFASRLKKAGNVLMPISLACLGLFILGYGMLVSHILLDFKLETARPTTALFIYTLLLYGMYAQQSRNKTSLGYEALMLYAGHLAFIVCLIDWVKQDIYLSALWAIYGVILLLVAMRLKDKTIGQSALLIFSAAAFKVLLFDLSGADSMVRVLVLLVLSGSLYAGGWLYQMLVRDTLDQATNTR